MKTRDLPLRQQPREQKSPKTNGNDTHRDSIRFFGIFGILAGLAYGIATPAISQGTFIHPFALRMVEEVTELVASTSGFALRLLGEDITVIGTRIIGSATALNIQRGCDGILATGLLVAAVVAFPAPWRRRLGGVALGTSVLQIGNLIRVIILYYVAKSGPPWVFDFAHEDAGQVFFIALAMACFLWWVKRLPGARCPSP